MNCKEVKLVACFLLICQSVFCQFDPLVKNIQLTDNFNTEHSREKIFIHLDKPYYNLKDTIWLKGYLLTAKDLVAADSSKIVYLELFNAAAELIKRKSTYAAAGIFYANILLNESELKPGTYILRVYTNHLRNYGDPFFSESRIQIFDAVDNMGENSIHDKNVGRSGQKQNLNYGKHSLQQGQGQQLDLQFLPEGGTFIAGKLQRLGFKAIDIFGKGVFVQGKILNSRNETICTFKSIHHGMGKVWIKPALNETYTVVPDNGQRITLPKPQQSGTQLQVVDEPGLDSIIVFVDASPDLYNKAYYFRASSRGISCVKGVVRVNGNPYRLAISRRAFPSGICRFTLYDQDQLPVNERIVLNWLQDTLNLDLLTQKQEYGTRDSVSILLKAKNKNQEPVIGSFSVAVIDTGLVHFPAYPENIISYLLLSSELKDRVEEPAYYFDHPDRGAIDALMLTQGYVQYDRIFTKPAYEYEQAFTVSGKVKNLINKPLANADMLLFGKDGKNSSFISNGSTDEKGNFTMKDLPVFLTDTVSMLIRALNSKGWAFGINIEINKPDFPEYHTTLLDERTDDIQSDTITIRYLKAQANTKIQLKKDKGYLPEVILKGKIAIPGSKNLNEDGAADQVIGKKVFDKAPKESLLDVLTKQLPGFHKGNLASSNLLAYKRKGDLVVFIIDGYNINQYYEPGSESSAAFADYEDSYLKYITAEELAGIEVMNSQKNSFAYEKYYKLTSSALMSYTFIEITTVSGNGAFNKKVPGMYLYNPVAPSIAKTFYSPRYGTTIDSSFTDQRATLFWKPDILTNEKGEARFSFFTSDHSGGYLVVVQGTDLLGGLGAGYERIEVRR